MRKFRMWYRLVIIWGTRHIKKIIRKIGELMKVYGRKLEHIGDDNTPKWSTKLFHKCYLADVEIHFPREVCKGVIDSIYQKHSGKDSELVIVLKSATLIQDLGPCCEVLEHRQFVLRGYGAPVIIKEAGHDCVWTSFTDGGYLAIFF